MGFKKTNRFQLMSAGVMSGTSTITTLVQDVSNFDNCGLQVQWTGTPTGIISVLASIDGVNFYALTFNPGLAQPAGSASGYLINLNQFPYPYYKVQYVNASGSGVLNIWLYSKDLN